MCGGAGEKILYVWGINAPKFKLPPGKSVPSVYYQTNILYSRSSHKRPPLEFEKVVVTRAVRLQEHALVSDPW